MLDIIIPTLKSRESVSPLVEEILRTAGCNVRVIPTCRQVSAAANRNIGLNESTSDPLIMVDDDVSGFPQGWAVKLASVLHDYPACVMVSAQLAKPGGIEPGPMMGGCQVRRAGVTPAAERKLPTACIAVRRNELRFDEAFVGSGFEDDDYCYQLRAQYPDATFLVCHDVWVTHANEMKNQRGEHWERNKRYIQKKWGVILGIHQSADKKLIALIKAFRGGEWLPTCLDAIAGSVDGIVAVLSQKAWTGGPLQNNCTAALEGRSVETVWCEAPHQERQYQNGLETICSRWGEDAAVLLVDTDEIWDADSLARLRAHIERNPRSHYFTAHIYTYLRSPLYQVFPLETAMPCVALQSARPQPIVGRFLERSAGPIKRCDDVGFHHYSYVRENEEEIGVKFAATSSQEKIASRPEWLRTVWPRLPLGNNLHMTTGWEHCWRSIKVLPAPQPGLPEFCRRIIAEEDRRWRALVEDQSPDDSLLCTPNREDWEKYRGEISALAADVTFLRSHLKMTYLEALVLHGFAGTVPRDGQILEVGSGSGGSLACMALASDAALWAVDPFEPYTEVALSTVHGVTEGNEGEFWAMADRYGYRDRVLHIKMRSHDAALAHPRERFDLVLIDGNHSHEIIKGDLELYWPLVKPGGVMLVHDYATRFPGVIRAMSEWPVTYAVRAGTSLAYAYKEQ